LFFYYYCQWCQISFPYYPYALLTFSSIYFSNFASLYLVNCRLKREAGRYSSMTIINTLFGATLAILLVVIYKYGATGRLLAVLLASMVTAAYCFNQLLGKIQFDFSVIKDAFRFGWPLSLSAMLWYFLSGVDRVMLEKLNDTNALGYYNVGIQIAGYFAIFYTVIAQTFEPDIYKAIAENKKAKLVKIITGIVLLNALPNIVFIIFSQKIIGLLTCNRYIDSSEYAQIMALKNISVSFYYSVFNIIVGYGFTKAELVIRVIGSILCVLMFKQLILKYGFYGAAWGQVLSFVIITVISLSCLAYIKFFRKVHI